MKSFYLRQWPVFLAGTFWLTVAGAALWWFGTDASAARPDILNDESSLAQVMVFEAPNSAGNNDYLSFIRRREREEWQTMTMYSWATPQMRVSRDGQMLSLGPYPMPYQTFECAKGKIENVAVLSSVPFHIAEKRFHAQQRKHGPFENLHFRRRRASLWRWRDREEKELYRLAAWSQVD